MGKLRIPGLIIYAFTLGILYAILGLIEFALGLQHIHGSCSPLQWWIPIDLFGGLSNVVIGLTFLSSIRRFRELYDSLSYILVATLMSTIFGTLYVLIALSNGFSSYLTGEEWNWMVDIRPEIWLSVASIPLTYRTWSVARRVSK